VQKTALDILIATYFEFVVVKKANESVVYAISARFILDTEMPELVREYEARAYTTPDRQYGIVLNL